MAERLALEVVARETATGVLLKVEQGTERLRQRVDQVAARMSAAVSGSAKWEEGLRRLRLQQDALDGSAGKAAASSLRMRDGLGKVSNAVTNLAGNVLGAQGPIARLGEGLLAMGIGGGPVAILAAAIVGLGGAVAYFTREARAAEAAYDAYVKSLNQPAPLEIIGNQIEQLRLQLASPDYGGYRQVLGRSLLGQLLGIQTSEELQTELDQALVHYERALQRLANERRKVQERFAEQAGREAKQAEEKRIREAKEAEEKRVRDVLARSEVLNRPFLQGGPRVVGGQGLAVRPMEGLADMRVAEGAITGLINPMSELSEATVEFGLAFLDALDPVKQFNVETATTAQLLGALTGSFIVEWKAAWMDATAAIVGGTSVWKAFEKALTGAMANAALKKAQLYIAEGFAKIAQGLFPPQPQLIASGSLMVAKGAALAAVARAVGGGAGVGVSGGGGGGLATTQTAVARESSAPTTIIIGDEGVYTRDRVIQIVGQAMREINGRRIVVEAA